MVSKRTLPKGRNPLVEPVHSPGLAQLVERRRLGRTNLSAKTTQIGVANASKPENLGPFDYAHLRVPLPKDLKGSGIFALGKSNGQYPESYFLMRRSSDGFVSATGMFKAAFPWASIDEEEAERKHHKSLLSAGPEEVAGNVWIHPEQALDLADEYGMREWIIALVDPEPIDKGTKSPERDEIATPPKFLLKDVQLPPPTSTRGSTRKRSTRSASPSKIATPSRKIASPRKPRASRKKKTDDDAASVASATLQNVLENGTHDLTPSIASDSVDGVAGSAIEGGAVADSVKVAVDEVVTKDGDKEITKTSVVIDMPAGHPELPLPENTDDMLAKAQEIVEKAVADDKKLAAANGVKPTRKRKVSEVEADDELAEASGAAAPGDALAEMQPAAKKTKTLAENLKKEKVRTRALIGVGFTLAIGAAIPYFL